MGTFRSLVYLVVEKDHEYRLKFRCECEQSDQWLTKVHRNSFWIAVTDTTSRIVFYDKEVSSSIIKRPLSFNPMSQEEISYLNIGIEKADKSCCQNKRKPISEIIGFVESTIRLSKSDQM
jgi:hypothetical protein